MVEWFKALVLKTISQQSYNKGSGDILATLNQRGLIGKQEATDINTGGRKTYYYFAKGKLPI